MQVSQISALVEALLLGTNPSMVADRRKAPVTTRSHSGTFLDFGRVELFDRAQSVYQDVLSAINIVGLSEDGSNHHQATIKPDVTVPISQIYLNRSILDSVMESVVENYIYFIGEWNGRFPTHRRPFHISSMDNHAFDQLARLGLVRQLNTKEYQWTDKVGNIMRRVNLWDENERPCEERLAAEDRAEAERFWNTLPIRVKGDISKKLHNGEEITAVVFELIKLRWDGERFHTSDIPEEKRRSWSLITAMKLSEHIKDAVRAG